MIDEEFLQPDRIFDGETTRAGWSVGIADGRVTRLLPAEDVPPGGSVRALPGTTLTPGLIDAHVHLTPWMVYGLLAAGVTTVRDLGNDLDAITARLDALGAQPRPTVYWSGPLLEGTRVNWPSVARAHTDPDAVRESVRDLAARGVRSIKLYANATPEIMAAAAEEAHASGLRVLGHVGASTLDEAVAAGVDELQHLAGCLGSDLGIADPVAAADAVAERPVDHCTTLSVWQALAHLGAPREQRDTAMAWVHPEARAAWATAYHAGQPAAERIRRSRELLERMAMVPRLRAAGRGILVGSDAPFPGLIPGFSLHDEAWLLVESGMTALEVMRAATAGNADHMGISHAGRIAEGEPADLALFDGDPTTRIADLARVRGTWLAGREVDRPELRAAADRTFAEPAESPVDLIARLDFVPATVAR